MQRRKGQYAAARDSYGAALAAYPDFHFAHRNLACFVTCISATRRAPSEHYEAYMRLAPQDPEPTKWIADLHNRTRTQEAP